MSNASGRFSVLDLEPVLDADGSPVFLAGNYAVVFKVISGSEKALSAVKCFIRDIPELETRQAAIINHINKSKSRYLIDLVFLPNELFVTSSIAESGEYSVVVMPWIEGTSLGSVLKKLCGKDHRKGLAALTRALAHICQDMLSRGIAHGDLKHDNILVTPEGQLRLIDYDSMYTPQMKGMRSTQLGGASYQHPLRDTWHFDASLDRFSMLVMTLSMRALAIDPGLYERFNTGENIIFTATDFKDVMGSALFGHLRKSPDALVRAWTRALQKSCQARTIAVPGLDKILRQARNANEQVKTSVGGFSIF
jgi:serine/threonine protein kinase